LLEREIIVKRNSWKMEEEQGVLLQLIHIGLQHPLLDLNLLITVVIIMMKGIF
jgi:hypothetical protein